MQLGDGDGVEMELEAGATVEAIYIRRSRSRSGALAHRMTESGISLHVARCYPAFLSLTHAYITRIWI